ncbi:hypothetical protein [Hydrocarboniphaga sp.]|uniref:hypothetical protein n=1 Tax=Hydrocarboniphaga sp. TaxID=2033016 RepID=UPI003D09FB04
MTMLLALCTPLAASALYDPAPDAAFAASEGAWTGSLTYKDYQKPDRKVVLPTLAFASLTAANELALHFVFDDGPGKTVHSYERLRFDLAAQILQWSSGSEPPSEWKITSVSRSAGVLSMVAERHRQDEDGSRWLRCRFEFGGKALRIEEDDGAELANLSFRNRYEFTRLP